MTADPIEDGNTEAPRYYPEVAGPLLANGWAPLPLPKGRKKPPPEGWTGADGMWPSGADVAEWVDHWSHAKGNTAVRFPKGAAALDVDAYRGGGDTLQRLTEELGPLPATWIVSARAAGSGNGHRLYRLPAGIDEADMRTGTGGIDVLRFGHRYSIAPGSTNPDAEGAVYRCWHEETGEVLDTFPPVAELPELPEVWARAFLKPEGREEAAGAAWEEGQEGTEEAREWAAGFLARQCAKVAGAPEGTRNGALNTAALVVGHYVPHLIGHAVAVERLHDAAKRCGLGKTEARATIRSALAKGMSEPQNAPPEYEVPAWDPPVDACTLAEVRATFRKWFGPRFDMQYLNVVLAVTASGLHDQGDAVWVLFVGGAGVGKTEAIGSTAMAGCIVVSTIGTEAALLSGTPAKQRAKNATGGLLRQVGDRGVVVIKDFTTILSMHRDDRAKVLAALREIYDGHWVRTIGAEGGRSLEWRGRCTVLGGVTSVYDEHHGVIAAMGDRFLLCRVASDDPEVRRHATIQALRNAGGEVAMRAELGEVVAGLMRTLTPWPIGDIPEDLLHEVVGMADLVAKSRSQVAKDFKGDPQWAHSPEMPTRLAKQLIAAWRGARTIGLDDEQARGIVRRLAHDSIPPARRIVLLDVWDHPGTATSDVARRTGLSRTTADRTLQELGLHGLILKRTGGPAGGAWLWSPAGIEIDLDILREGYSEDLPGNVPPPCGEDADDTPRAQSDSSFTQEHAQDDVSGEGSVLRCRGCGKPLPPSMAALAPKFHLCSPCARAASTTTKENAS